MPSTLTATTAYAAHTLSILSLLAAATNAHAHSPSLLSHPAARRGLATMTYEGCYSSSSGLTDQGSYTYQTSGYCQPICVDAKQAVLATSGGSDCWCGDVLPPADSKVNDSNCDTPCNGYGSENCGGTGFYSVYLSGTEDSVPNYSGSDSSSSSTTTVRSSSTTGAASSTTTPSTTTSTTATPVVVTSVAPGHTVVVTMPASQQASSTASATPSAESKHSSSTNVAGVAAGAVVGVLAVAAIVAGLFFWLRHRRRQAVQDDYSRKHQVTDFFSSGGGEIKPPPTAYSNMSDSRLDPTAGRRNSIGSIADDQDYSRRILRVANPDDSGN
ncbi:hypothetical protein LTR85_010617 [Meristemomyces frigidus]|nr:hypothetical protein LTR85_010617 [Meristemomyces frigidus]